MSEKLLNKDLKKTCKWCAYGKSSKFTNEFFCKKRGVTTVEDFCRKYKYDPLKRTPDTQKITDNYTEDDFSL